MYTAHGRTDSEQHEAHGVACITYAREALEAGDTGAAEAHLAAAEAHLAAAARA